MESVSIRVPLITASGRLDPCLFNSEGAGKAAGGGRGGAEGRGGDAVGPGQGWWLNAGAVVRSLSPNTGLGQRANPQLLPSFSAAFCKALS